uniref:Uncharacterized protein n=1 Tax=Acrobeloides nanus TaxID=290746 RepID=A0A914EK66_9BILA
MQDEETCLKTPILENSRSSKRLILSRQIPNFILLSTFIVISILCLIFLKKSQDDLLPHYHDFADKREILGIPNFFNVSSNGFFVIFGLIGIYMMVLLKRDTEVERVRMNSVESLTYIFFFLAIVGTGFGSGYYHWNPDTNTLFWDRFFISLAIMAFFSVMLNERVLPEICPIKEKM